MLETPIENHENESGRPSIGIALGSGAARGWAHIGVLQVLKSAGVLPKVISGSSIGAVVGGAFASGRLEVLEEFATKLTTRSLFALADFSLFSSGLVVGKKLDRKLETFFSDLKIEELDTRLVLLATELATGHEIWLRRGELVPLMKASFALPGLLKPVSINGRLLVDGALTNPVPVSVCRAYGARLVIAVNLSPETLSHGATVPDLPDFSDNDDRLFSLGVFGKTRAIRAAMKHQLGGSKGAPRGIPAVMMQSYTIIQDRLTRSRLAGDPPDVTISPYIGDIGLFDFQRADEAIAAGRAAAERALPEIERLQNSLAAR